MQGAAGIVLTIIFAISLHYCISLAGNSKSSSRPNTPSKGFGSPNIKPISKPSSNPLLALEASIQESINKCSGLREAMAIADEIEAYDLKMKLADGIDKIQYMQTYAQDIEKKRKILSSEGFRGWNLALIRSKLQEITWDNTASIREQRHKEKSQDISSNVRNHMLEVARYALHRDNTAKDSSFIPTILDVGCGTGITFQFINEYISRDSDPNIDEVMSKCYGVDLSNEMIQICKQNYPKSNVQHVDYNAYSPNVKFSSIVFNECIHNFDKIETTLNHACSMLAEDGRIILSHPRGYENVFTQRNTNKWLSPSLLPSESEVKQLADKLALKAMVLPDTKSPQYLAVFAKN